MKEHPAHIAIQSNTDVYKRQVKWNLQDVCYIHVRKPGGLASGNHKVQVIFWEVASYIPPFLDEMRMKQEDDPEDPSNTREMIIV